MSMHCLSVFLSVSLWFVGDNSSFFAAKVTKRHPMQGLCLELLPKFVVKYETTGGNS